MNPKYVHILPGAELPDQVFGNPFAAVVIIEMDVTAEWRSTVSRWLVDTGCLYMMSWGTDCSMWDDSVDHANLEDWDYGDIPEDRLVLTTWHANDPLETVLWFAQHGAHHEQLKSGSLLLLDISPNPREDFILAEFARSKNLV